jgi:sugar-specific transcriptional regulator TrmB
MPTHSSSKRHFESLRLKKERDDIRKEREARSKQELIFGNLSTKQKMRWILKESRREFRLACEFEYDNI